MKIKYLTLLLVALIVILGLSYYFSFGNNTESDKTTEQEVVENKQYIVSENPQEVIETVEQEGHTEQAVISEEVPKEEKISIMRNIFSPKTLTIQKGTTVRWINNDQDVHQIKEVSVDSFFRSERINPGESYAVTFTKIGEYTYIDTIYNYMSGKIIVTDGLGAITGNAVRFVKSQPNVVTLLLFIALGLTIIHTIENSGKRKK